MSAFRRFATGVLFDDAAVAEADDACPVLGDVVLVRDQQDGDALLGIQALKDAHHFDARSRVEVAGRLVGENQRRLIDQRARNRDALLLPARQLIRMMVRALAEAHRFQRGHGARVPLGRFHRLVRVEQRQLDVIERRGARQQVEPLKHEPDLVVAHFGELVAAELGDVASVEEILAARRMIEAAEDVHQRRLARA